MKENNLKNFREWWYEVIDKKVSPADIYNVTMETPIKYMMWKTIFNQVASIYHEKYRSDIKYQEKMGEIENLIAEVTAMTFFCFREHLDDIVKKYK